MKRLALVIATLALAVPAVEAQAHEDGPTEYEALLMADRWAAKEVPHLPNHCANGRRTITRSNADVERTFPGQSVLGYADGWYWTGYAHAWDHARCTWTTREDLDPDQQCATDAHEQMHFVIGPQHEGPLDPRHPGPVECFKHGEPVLRVRRTARQIARSIRYRKAQAKIKARAAMRRMHR